MTIQQTFALGLEVTGWGMGVVFLTLLVVAGVTWGLDRAEATERMCDARDCRVLDAESRGPDDGLRCALVADGLARAGRWPISSQTSDGAIRLTFLWCMPATYTSTHAGRSLRSSPALTTGASTTHWPVVAAAEGRPIIVCCTWLVSKRGRV